MNVFRKISTKNHQSYIHSLGCNYSYENLNKDADKFSRLSLNRPLVLIVANNSYECLAFYVGMLRANAVVALVNDSIHESVLVDLILNFKPSLIYIPKNLFKIENNWREVVKFGNYVLYETKIKIDYVLNDELSTLLMTSGSTGSPEFVRLSHANIYSNTKSICEYLKCFG